MEHRERGRVHETVEAHAAEEAHVVADDGVVDACVGHGREGRGDALRIAAGEIDRWDHPDP
jgi:hypothetical protein